MLVMKVPMKNQPKIRPVVRVSTSSPFVRPAENLPDGVK